jgi:hypothetical protein
MNLTYSQNRMFDYSYHIYLNTRSSRLLILNTNSIDMCVYYVNINKFLLIPEHNY